MAGKRPEIEALLAGHLEAELGDAATAGTFARLLVEDALSWRPPTLPPAGIRSIFGFTFGNRMQANGNRRPGPVNEALAEVAVRLHRQTGARIWAQWEVAEAIGDRVQAGMLEAIHPARGPDAEPRYLGTAAVVDAILARRRPEEFGPVAVVALRDHAWRCVRICRERGLAAGVPEGWAMPESYDAQSGQPWTRGRLAYLLHDLHCRALDRRDAVCGI